MVVKLHICMHESGQKHTLYKGYARYFCAGATAMSTVFFCCKHHV